MRFRTALAVTVLGLAAWGVLHAQKPFKEYPAIEYENFALPPDWKNQTEWTRARLRYPDITGYPSNAFGGRFSFAGYWNARNSKEGGFVASGCSVLQFR